MNEDKALKILAEAFDKAVKEFGEKKLVEAICKQGENVEIKVGQKWRTRGGVVVEIVKDDGSALVPFLSNKGFWYNRNGCWTLSEQSEHDLIELIREGQCRTGTVTLYTAESLRERIFEIDKERAELVKQLAELGFTLIGNHDPRDWQKGDVVECVMDSDYFTAGKLYVIERGEDKYGDVIIQEDDEGDECWYNAKNFKFHHRP